MFVKVQDKQGNLVDPSTGKVANGKAIEVYASTDYVTLLVARSRWGYTIFNNSTSPMYLKYDGTDYSTWSVRIPPKWYFESPLPVYQGGMSGKWDVAVGEAHVTEFI